MSHESDPNPVPKLNGGFWSKVHEYLKSVRTPVTESRRLGTGNLSGEELRKLTLYSWEYELTARGMTHQEARRMISLKRYHRDYIRSLASHSQGNVI